MKIRHLPEPLRTMAIENLDDVFVGDKEIELHSAFIWDNAPQGGKFWSLIDDGQYQNNHIREYFLRNCIPCDFKIFDNDINKRITRAF